MICRYVHRRSVVRPTHMRKREVPMPSRAFAVVGAGIGATVLAAAGITYASTVESTPASSPVHRAAQPPHHPIQPAHRSARPAQHTASAASAATAASAMAASGAKTGDGGENGGRDGGGRDGGGRDGGSWGRDGGGGRGGGERGDGGGGRDGGGRGDGHGRGGRIFVNERSYPAFIDGCITAVSGLGARSFNVRNESRRTVEVFRGPNCDGGPPVATVGPRSETFGVMPRDHGGVFVHHGVVGSFRVVCGWW